MSDDTRQTVIDYLQGEGFDDEMIEVALAHIEYSVVILKNSLDSYMSVDEL